MKGRLILGAIAFLLGAGMFGCSNTGQGLEQDASQNAQKISQATERASEATKEAAKNTTAALEVTPKVKDAILADSQLRDSRNHINVESKDGVVHLQGTVYSGEMKNKAGEVAQKALTDMNATDKLSNELTISQ